MTHKIRTILPVWLSIISLLSLISTASMASDPSPAESKQLEAWWTDLEGDDFRATLALLDFADQPAVSVPFFKAKLQPLKLDAVRLKAYLLRLGSDNETLWKQAFSDLEYFDPRLAMDLTALMDKVTETPARQRLVEILSGREAGSLKDKKLELKKFDNFFNFFDGRGTWWAEPKLSELNSRSWGGEKKKWTRAVRAIALLEHLHTPEAVAILKEMASGHPDAQPTRRARESLERLKIGKSEGTRVKAPSTRKAGA